MSLKSEILSIRSLIYRRLYINKQKEKNVVDEFHSLFYDSFLFNKTWGESTWLGTHIKKCPFDTWMYQELLYEVKPDLIIECGTYKGGSAYYLATLCDLMNNGKIVTIDIEEHPNKPVHPRITYLTGSTLDPEIINQVEKHVKEAKNVLVILDDDHTCDHVYKELLAYSKYVSLNSYLLVEDSNINGHPVYPEFGPGPFEAIEKFLPQQHSFIIDKSKEKFYLTFNPNGYLKKIKE